MWVTWRTTTRRTRQEKQLENLLSPVVFFFFWLFSLLCRWKELLQELPKKSDTNNWKCCHAFAPHCSIPISLVLPIAISFCKPIAISFYFHVYRWFIECRNSGTSTEIGDFGPDRGIGFLFFQFVFGGGLSISYPRSSNFSARYFVFNLLWHFWFAVP